MTVTFNRRQFQAALTAGYRSGLEETIDSQLEALGLGGHYETEKIRYQKPSKASTYTPDFVFHKPKAMCPLCKGSGVNTEWEDGGKSCAVFDCPGCDGRGKYIPTLVIETKGRFVTADRQKHLLIKEQHPLIEVRFVFQNSRQKISKKSKTTYADWCGKHGFVFADKVVPNGWLEGWR